MTRARGLLPPRRSWRRENSRICLSPASRNDLPLAVLMVHGIPRQVNGEMKRWPRRSGQANRVCRLEALPAAIRDEDSQRLLTSSAQAERDERVVAHGGREHEVADAVGPIEDFQSGEIERFGLLDEDAIAQGQTCATGMTDGHLNVDQFIAADPRVSNELGNTDPGRVNVEPAGSCGKGSGSASPRAVGDLDRLP